MLDLVRTSLHRILTTPKGDAFLPLRLQKDLARRVNTVLGEPICSADELARRRAAQARLAELRANPTTATEAAPVPREPAPVTIYFEKDRNTRLLGRIKDTLGARGIAFTELDVAGDAVSKDYVMREAKCKEDDLPIVFVANAVVGGYNDLVEWDVSGKLGKAVFG